MRQLEQCPKFIILNNGVKMPALGFGCDYIEDGSEVINSVKLAIKAGIRLIDTAAYYQNETGVGIAIKDYIQENIVTREDIFVTTKLRIHERGAESTRKAFYDSITKLDLDYVDLYLIHWPMTNFDEDWKTLNNQTWCIFEELYEQGKIKALGTSNFLPHHLEPLLEYAKIKPMVNQLEIHPQWQQKETVKFCRENKIVPNGWGTLAHGRVLNNVLLRDIASKYDKTVAQICLRWSVQKGIVPLFKSVTPGYIYENADIWNFEISIEDMQTIDSLNGTHFSGMHPDMNAQFWHCTYEMQNLKDFPVIPFLKMKQYHEKAKYYLFGIPILKIKREKMWTAGAYSTRSVCKYYLFGFIPMTSKQVKSSKTKKQTNFRTRNLKLMIDQWGFSRLGFPEKYKKTRNGWIVFLMKHSSGKFLFNFFKLRFFVLKKTSIPLLDIRITTSCSLKCKECAHFIPYYKMGFTITLEEFKRDLDRLLKSVDLIMGLSIVGGEPLLHKDLPGILKYAASKKQILHTFIITNGTVLPSRELLEALKNTERTSLRISNYSANQNIGNYLKIDELISILEQNSISYYLNPKELLWSPKSRLHIQNNDNYAKKTFKKCNLTHNYTLFDGRIYICPVAQYLHNNLKDEYNFSENDFINIRSDKNVRERCIDFYSRDFFKVCECCSGVDWTKQIPVSEQLKG
jgi:diketogulonate reductase-like aldo/keto reductase/organic radical activating enzyme